MVGLFFGHTELKLRAVGRTSQTKICLERTMKDDLPMSILTNNASIQSRFVE